MNVVEAYLFWLNGLSFVCSQLYACCFRQSLTVHEYFILVLVHSDSSSAKLSKPARSTWGMSFFASAYSISAKWQKTYWSGIWIEYARWERIRSTVPRTSTVPTSSRRLMHMSNVQKVPAKSLLAKVCKFKLKHLVQKKVNKMIK